MTGSVFLAVRHVSSHFSDTTASVEAMRTTDVGPLMTRGTGHVGTASIRTQGEPKSGGGEDFGHSTDVATSDSHPEIRRALTFDNVTSLTAATNPFSRSEIQLRGRFSNRHQSMFAASIFELEIFSSAEEGTITWAHLVQLGRHKISGHPSNPFLLAPIVGFHRSLFLDMLR
jgi:hypothetical protein